MNSLSQRAVSLIKKAANPIAFFTKILFYWSFFIPIFAEDRCKDIFTPETFAKSMTENLKLLKDHEDLFDLYKSNYFEDSKVNIERDFTDMMDVLEEHSELSKKVFREQEIAFEKKNYEVTESLKSLIEKFKAPYRTLSGKLFNVSSNLHFWKKILGFKKEEEFIKYFESFVSKKDMAFIDDKSKSYKERAVFLYKILNRIREDQKESQRLSQILLDLVHTVGLGDPYTSRLTRSKNAAERLESIHKLLSSRDEMAIELDFGGRFLELEKALGLSPSSLSKKEDIYELLKEVEEEFYKSSYNKSDLQSFRVRALSLQESPFRSCLGSSDCSSRVYFFKALDPNFIYWTLTDKEYRSSGHITVVLGEAKDERGRKTLIGFVDKIQNIPRERIIPMLEAVRRSLKEEGYSLGLPEDAGDENGLSNSLTTREYIEKEVNPRLREKLLAFKPHKHSYNFSSGYSRADEKLELYKYKAEVFDLELEMRPGKRHPVQTVSKALNKERLFDQIISLKSSKREEDQIRFIRYVEWIFDLKLLSFEELRGNLKNKVGSSEFSFQVRKQSFFALVELYESLRKKLGYDELQELLSEFSKEEQKILTGEMSNWSEGNNVKRRDFIKGLLFGTGRSEKEMISILNSELLNPLININMKSQFGPNALMWAIKNKRLEMAELLIEKGIDIHKMTGGGYNALMYAIKYNQLALAKLLIEKGIDIHAMNLFGQNAFILAIIGGHKDFIEFLIEKGVDIHVIENIYGKNAFLWAIEQADLDIIKMLIEKGVDIHSVDLDGINALMWAVERGEPDLIRLLLEKGIDINIATSSGYNALMYALEINQLEIAKLLIEQGIDTDAVDLDGKSALTYAVEYEQESLVKLLTTQ